MQTTSQNSQRSSHTLLQAATSPHTKQSLQESVPAPTQEKIVFKKFPTLQKIKNTQRTVLTLTVTASNVNHFGESMCELLTEQLRGKSMAAANRKLSKILKKGAVVVNQSVVLLMKCVQVQFFATQESGRNFFYFVANNCVNRVLLIPLF